MKLLDRYVLRNFLEPFAICFIGFIAIWLIFDLSDNGPDFIEAKTSPKQIARFYLTQLPQTILISSPVGLLLALLFSLSRMSRSNEIISMLTAGRSVTRLLVPLIVVGLIASAACILLNYELAPKAEAGKRAALEQITRGGKKSGKRGSVAGHLFVDRQNHRVWYVRKMRSDSPVLEGVHVSQRNPSGGIVRKWYAKRATYNGRDGTWEFARGRAVDFDAEGDILRTDDFSSQFRVVSGWSETPWRIASSQLEAQNLSIPDLRDYLKHNLDFPEAQLAPYRTYLQHRWALPWSCLVVVFIAAPLGIVYSRRAVLAGVASSIFIFFGMIFLTNFFLAMGKGARVDPFVAAWLPNLFFFTLGVVLLYFRSTNRDYPKLFVRRR